MVGGLLGNRRDDASDSFSDETPDTDPRANAAAIRDTTFADDTARSIVTPRSDAAQLSERDATHESTNAARDGIGLLSRTPIGDDYRAATAAQPETPATYSAQKVSDRDYSLAEDDRTIEVTALAATADDDAPVRSDDDAIDADEMMDDSERWAVTSKPDAFASQADGSSFGSESIQRPPVMPDHGDRSGDQFIATPTFEPSAYEATDDVFASHRAAAIEPPVEFAPPAAPVNPAMDSESSYMSEQQPNLTTTPQAGAASAAPLVDAKDAMTSDDLLAGLPDLIAPAPVTSVSSADDNLLLDLEDLPSASPASNNARDAIASETDDGLLDLDDEMPGAPRAFAPDADDFNSFAAGREEAATTSGVERQAVTTPLIAPPIATGSPAPDQSATTQISIKQLAPEVVDQIARRVVELMSDRLVREIAWEVVPELAERMIRRRLETDESGL